AEGRGETLFLACFGQASISTLPETTRNYDGGWSRRDLSPMFDNSDSFSLSRWASFCPRLASSCSMVPCPAGLRWDCFFFWPVRLVVIGFYSVGVSVCLDNASA